MCQAVFWSGKVTSWSRVITVRLPGAQLGLQEVIVPGQEIVQLINPYKTTNNFTAIKNYLDLK